MNIIFHHPLPLDNNATSASGIRPLKMLAAFEALGYQVDLVTGYSKERKRCIKNIKKNIANGKKYDFVYAESSTMPTILTDLHHLPLHPFMDWLFFRFCKKNNIKTGLFYRDIYWLFEGYGIGMNPIKTTVAKISYYFDLWVYKWTLSKLYLPSLEMGKYVPIIDPATFEALPPGHEISKFIRNKRSLKEPNKKLKIFYVGGMSDHYQMHILFSVLNDRDDIDFTLCTRASEWQAVKSEYPPLSSNIKIVHKIGAEMQALMADSDVVSIFVKPQEYREFAAPVKLYEYLGHCKPIISSQGTLAGRFVSEHELGWSLPYKEQALHELFDNLKNTPEMLINVQEQMNLVATTHTWQARAQKVIKDLT